MVYIGEIYISGKEGHPKTGTIYPSGVSFLLSKKSPINDVFEFESGKWEVEIQKNNQQIVARCKDILPEEQLLRIGFDFSQKYLDLLSVSKKITLGIDHPDQKYILVFNKENRAIGRMVSNGDLGVSTEVTITITDKEGKIVEPPPIPQPEWNPSFRYYRISQSGSDLYDAYRNLYLAFESLMQNITPINPGERETDWVNRALQVIGQKIPLNTLVPEGKDPIPYIAGVYYEHFRCKTFHAKNRNYILPHEWADAEKLTEAYEGLLRIWRETAATFNNVPNGGGVVTYQGFVVLMDSVASQGISMQITDDPSPANVEDTQVNPQGYAVCSTNDCSYVRDFKPGVVLFKGEFNPDEINFEKIHRVGRKSGATLMTIEFYDEGIKPVGIDKLENYETFRLINKSSPKVIF